MQRHTYATDEHQNHQESESTARQLLERAAGAEADERRRLIDEVVLLYLGLAESIARRYAGRGVERDDLLQVARLGLVAAAHRFDPSLGKDFVSFAVPTISGEVKRYFRDHGWAVRPPRRVQELAAQVSVATAEVAQTSGTTPTQAELAEHLGVEADEIREASASHDCFTAASLDYRGFNDEETSLVETLGDDEDGYDRTETMVLLAPVCRELKPRDRHILYLRFFKGRTQQEIGTELGVTQMQVSRLLTRILGQLRERVGNRPPAPGRPG
ncbi:SigB/SigF/SigG family RNA polymerase sigma factor [Jiangella endophytica]|uniref:SigB/SigF/SigG family RNA polymerase sigma factor n=1 Tax=Jiangella endophytica TaxID=1623398 RepID=UPI000E34EBBB|nr:SigB/SigF/SigG family RNA polymerase sigma factor [Jiangella endophytica]